MVSKEGDELAKRVKQLGHDYEFYQQISKLEELKKMVKEGRVAQDVYDQLEEAVLKTEAQRVGRQKGSGSAVFTNIRNLMRMPKKKKTPTEKLKSKESNVREHSRSRGISLRSRGDSYKSTLSFKSERNLRVKKPEARIVVEGELLKFVRSRKHRVWKKLYAILLQDRLEFYAVKGDKKVIKTITLSGDFYVSEIHQGVLKRATTSPGAENLRAQDDETMGTNSDEEEKDEHTEMLMNSINKEDELLDKPHVFVVSDINHKTKIFLAAESEEKKFFWVTMLVEIIRDLNKKPSNAGDDPVISRNPEHAKKIWDDYENRANAYVQKQIGRNLNPNKAENLDGNKFQGQMNRWVVQGKKVARKSVVQDWRSRELETVKEAMKEREELKRKLIDKDKEFVEFKEQKEKELKDYKDSKEKEIKEYKDENENLHKKYDELMVKYRAEALARREEKLREEKRLQKEIKSLRRMSVMPMSDAARDYEAEIEMYKKKLETLQKALNVDFDELDWDGTLEQAEEKMKECLQNIINGETPAIQQKAQTDFDKWDQLVRNHEDYINRERNKWKNWEDENFEKNIDALNEMREKFVPEIYLNGCSEKQLMEATGIKQKTAARIMKNKIFKFLWMDKDRIAKIHSADLLNNYASQGLDIRELRAVYSSLPDEFMNDNDGKKKQFRSNLRARLFELTKKEASGTLTSAEKLNNAYRDRAVRDNVPKLPKVKREKKVNNKLAGQAAALEAFFKKQQGGSIRDVPKKSKPATEKDGIDPDAEEWKTYFKMQKMGLAEGAIRQKLQKDGKDPNLWDKLKAAKSGGGGSAKENKLDPDAEEWKTYFKMQKMGLAEGAIRQKLQKDGKDPNLWDKLKAAKSKQGGGTPEKLDPEDEIWSGYFKMKKMGLNDGQVMNKMQKDGRDPNVWHQLVKLKGKSSPSKPSLKTAATTGMLEERTVSKPAEKAAGISSSRSQPKSDSAKSDGREGKTIKKVKGRATISFATISEENIEDANANVADEIKRAIQKPKARKSKTNGIIDENGKTIRKKKKKRSKFNSVADLGERADSITGMISISNKKPTRRKTRRAGSKSDWHTLQASATDLLKRAQIDCEVDEIANIKRGSHALGIMEYSEHVNKGKKNSIVGAKAPNGKKTLRKSKVGKMIQIEDTLQEVIDVIVADGFYDEAEGGVKSMKFGELFDRFISISDMLVGLLLKGKKTGQLKYKGDMLFKGIHDEIKITVLS